MYHPTLFLLLLHLMYVQLVVIIKVSIALLAQEKAVRLYAAFHYYCYTSQCRSSHLCNPSCMCPTCMPSLMGARSVDKFFTRRMDFMVLLKSKKDNEFTAKVTPIKLFALQILNWHGMANPSPYSSTRDLCRKVTSFVLYAAFFFLSFFHKDSLDNW